MTVAQQFAANLRCHRKLADMSQEDLAVRASLHLTAVGTIERGLRLPRVDTVAKLAGALEVDPGELFEGIVWKPGGVRLGQFKPDQADTLPLSMAKRSKKPADLNRLAAAIVGDATDETPQEPESQQAQAGRIGGHRGGKVRAQRMTAEQRSAAARHAAESRWSQR